VTAAAISPADSSPTDFTRSGDPEADANGECSASTAVALSADVEVSAAAVAVIAVVAAAVVAPVGVVAPSPVGIAAGVKVSAVVLTLSVVAPGVDHSISVPVVFSTISYTLALSAAAEV